MGNRVKKILSLLLVLAMLMGMSVTSFAAEDTDSDESQPALRVAAPPITSLRVIDCEWKESEKCFEFVIEEMGTGPGDVTFAGKKLNAYKAEGIMNASNTYAIGWELYYKTQRIYSPGTYQMSAVFNSTNGTPKVWTLNKNFEVTEVMLGW